MTQEVVVIPLPHGRQTIVSIDDADLAGVKWHALKSRPGYYAVRTVGRGAKREYFRMNRVILERKIGRPLQKDEIADHINQDTLDNRRSNLRIATRSQNQMNRSMPRHNKTGYKGAILQAKTKRYAARIGLNGKSIHLGYYDTPEEAHAAYCEAAKKYHGEFARLQ